MGKVFSLSTKLSQSYLLVHIYSHLHLKTFYLISTSYEFLNIYLVNVEL